MTSPRSRTSPRGPNPRLIVGVVAAVLVLAVIGLVVASGSDDGGGDDAGDERTAATGEPYGVVSIEGDPLPPLGDGEDAAVGQVAPTVRSERGDREATLTPGEDGRPTMVVFLAHWCPHCQAEVPLLVDMAGDGAFDDVRTVAVLTGTTDTRPNFPPDEWLDREGWTGDRLHDDEASTAGAAYGLTGFPMLVFLDEDGRVTQRYSGQQPREAIQAAIDDLTD